jgi:surface protein
MFFGCKNFTGNLSGWNVSNVEEMNYMFCDCKNFTGKDLD